MIRFLKKLWSDRRGNALVIAGAALPLVLGSAGLASDTIQWALWKRQLQRAADSAAMAGVYAIVDGRAVGTCTNIATSTYANPVAWDVRTNNHVGVTPTCTVQNPPTVGGFTAQANAVRVSLSMQKALGFSSLFLPAAPTITATATANIVPAGDYCVVSLINTPSTGITATGNADVDLGCGMITNSTSMDAAIATGSSDVNASPIAAVGGIPGSDNWGADTVLQPFTLKQADPFANVYPPAESWYPPGNCPQLRVNSNESVNRSTDTGMICLREMTLNGTVALGSATYVIDAGSLSIGAQAHVSCNGCTIVLSSRTAATNPGSIGNVTINGGAELDMTAPDTGTYAGLLMYQDRRAPLTTNANTTNHINGNADSMFRGAFYFPRQETLFNGTAGMSTNCVQLVAYTVTFSGNMNINNTCPPGSGSGSFAGRQVRLVE